MGMVGIPPINMLMWGMVYDFVLPTLVGLMSSLTTRPKIDGDVSLLETWPFEVEK